MKKALNKVLKTFDPWLHGPSVDELLWLMDKGMTKWNGHVNACNKCYKMPIR